MPKITFKNPEFDFRQVLCIDQPYPHGSEWQHQAIHRLGIHATPGGRLVVLDGLASVASVRCLGPDKPGSYWRPDLSFDARRVLFCFKGENEKSFRLYETDLDANRPRQLTHSDYDDLDPIYLPTGIFSSPRPAAIPTCDVGRTSTRRSWPAAIATAKTSIS